MKNLTPDEIKAMHAEVTAKDVKSVAEALNAVLPAHKKISPSDAELLARECGTPHRALMSVLSNAYDWFAYGN